MIVKEINYGTGNRVGDTIYINRDLKKYAGLYEAVLAHEMRHTGGFKLKDMSLDLVNEDLKPLKREWLKFLLRHPRAWVNFLPVMRLEGQWTFDISLLIFWKLVLITLVLGWILI